MHIFWDFWKYENTYFQKCIYFGKILREAAAGSRIRPDLARERMHWSLMITDFRRKMLYNQSSPGWGIGIPWIFIIFSMETHYNFRLFRLPTHGWELWRSTPPTCVRADARADGAGCYASRVEPKQRVAVDIHHAPRRHQLRG